MERLVDPTLGFDWEFITEALGVEARKAAASATAAPRRREDADEEGRGGRARGGRRRGSAPLELGGEAAAFLEAWSKVGKEERTRWMRDAEGMLRRMWVECGVGARDQAMFEIAFLQKAKDAGGAGGEGEALGVAEHLSVLAEFVTARDAVRSAVRDRREVLEVLRTVLADFEAHGRPRCEQVLAPLRKGGDVGRGEVDAEFASFLKLPMSTVFPATGRAGLVEAMYSAMEEEERDMCKSLRVRVRVLLLALLQATLAVTEGIERMRRTMWRPHAVVLDGRNVLQEVRDGDAAFLLKFPLSCTLYFLRVPLDEVRTAAAFHAPPSPARGPGPAGAGAGGSATRALPTAAMAQGDGDGEGEGEMGFALDDDPDDVATATTGRLDGGGGSTYATILTSSVASGRGGTAAARTIPYRKLVVPPEFRAPELGSVLAWMGAEGVIPDLRVVQRVDRAVRLVQEEGETQWKIEYERRELETQALFIPTFRWRLR